MICPYCLESLRKRDPLHYSDLFWCANENCEKYGREFLRDSSGDFLIEEEEE